MFKFADLKAHNEDWKFEVDEQKLDDKPALTPEEEKEKWRDEMTQVGDDNMFYPFDAAKEAERASNNKGLYAFLYTLALIFLFLGIAIISDSFMEGIEYICRKAVVYQDAGGNLLMKRAWNLAVANVSLMAVGSSGPELCLALVGVVSGTNTGLVGFPTRGFVPDELGPTTGFSEACNVLWFLFLLVVTTRPLALVV